MYRRRDSAVVAWIAACVVLGVVLSALPCLAAAHEGTGLADVVEQVKPSIVGVGTFEPLRRPRARLLGTGFAIGDGRQVATNHHVIDVELAADRNERLVVFTGHGRDPGLRDARVVASDVHHDLAVLAIEGTALPPMTLGSDDTIREGDGIAFTGYPIGAVLGLFPVTHRGIVSAVTPIVIPAENSRHLGREHIRALRDPYLVYQLDATAYPGNSGSPVFRAADGRVIGVINQVHVKDTKESVLSNPSAITYAVPVKFLRVLMQSGGS